MKNLKIFISGNFNIIHPGHVRLLRSAKETGYRLIIGVVSDKLAGDTAIVSEDLRLEAVKSNINVDEAFVLHESIISYLMNKKPDIVMKGKEHENLYNIEQKIVDSYGGKLIFSAGEAKFSSIDLLQNEILNNNNNNNNNNKIKRQYASSFLKRKKINKNTLLKIVSNFKKLKVCVIGDLIIDHYIACEPLGMSQEEPTIVVSPINKQKYIGGAGIVAAHAAGLGANVDFITVTGNDTLKLYAENELKKNKVNFYFFVDETRPTPMKTRYRAKNNVLLKVSELKQEDISIELQQQIYNSIKSKIKEYDLIIFSDFNYGCLPDNLVKQILDLGKKYKKMIVADCQSSSQTGDIAKYKDLDLITPTEREARLSIKNYSNTLFVLTENLSEITNAKNILLKLGEEGVLIYTKTEITPHNHDLLKASSLYVTDVAGAGDSMLVAASLVLAVGGNIWEAGYLGSIAAGIQVSQIGNNPITYKKLISMACQ